MRRSARGQSRPQAKDQEQKADIKMNLLILEIPTKSEKHQETRDFYINNLEFHPKRENEDFLINSNFQNIALHLKPQKKYKGSKSIVLSFNLEKNLPSHCSKLRKSGVEIEIVTDMLESVYVSQITDPSDNCISFSSDSLIDDSGEKAEVLTID